MKQIILLVLIALSSQIAHGAACGSPIIFNFEEEELAFHQDDEDTFQDKTFFDIINLTFFHDFSKVEISTQAIKNSKQTYFLLNSDVSELLLTLQKNSQLTNTLLLKFLTKTKISKSLPITPKLLRTKENAPRQFNFRIQFSFSKETQKLTLTLKNYEMNSSEIELPLSYSDASHLMSIEDEKEETLTYLFSKNPTFLMERFMKLFKIEIQN